MRACLPPSRRPPHPRDAAPRGLAALPLVVVFLTLLGGCAARAPVAEPTRPEAVLTEGATVAALARGQVGEPYRFGGDGPGGFDCSGLVQYVHAQIGRVVPRTAAAQQSVAMPVPREALQPGDVVFFRFGRAAAVDHVGLYVGEGRFVHAPKAGAPVVVVELAAPWFERRYVAGGRFWR
jgi:murein DD-endopeptidase